MAPNPSRIPSSVSSSYRVDMDYQEVYQIVKEFKQPSLPLDRFVPSIVPDDVKDECIPSAPILESGDKVVFRSDKADLQQFPVLGEPVFVSKDFVEALVDNETRLNPEDRAYYNSIYSIGIYDAQTYLVRRFAGMPLIVDISNGKEFEVVEVSEDKSEATLKINDELFVVVATENLSWPGEEVEDNECFHPLFDSSYKEKIKKSLKTLKGADEVHYKSLHIPAAFNMESIRIRSFSTEIWQEITLNNKELLDKILLSK